MKALIVGLIAAALALPAAAQKKYDAGATDKEIKIGNTNPYSGPASAYGTIGKSIAAYFKMVNDQGGINGRKINFVSYDDGYSPPRTVEMARKLVEQDQVLLLFQTLGTPSNTAIQKYMNMQKVPQLHVATGATKWNDPKNFKWTMGWQPNYQTEGRIYAKHILATKPDAKIAVLYQNDDYGNDLLAGLKHGLGKRAKQIVSKQSYNADDPEVRSQIARLKSSKANTLMIFATPQFAIQAYRFAYQLGWKPKVYVNVVASASNVMNLAVLASSKKEVEGSISIVFLKDPSDPRWAKDPGIKLYRAIMKRYKDKGTNVNDVYNVYGMSVAHTFVQALKKAGKSPTRASIMNAATHLTIKNDPFLLPGVVVRTTPNDHFPLDQARLERWHNGHWASFGGLFRVR